MNEITEITRRAIMDFFAVSQISWTGRFGDDDFLARLYDLTKMPSTDYRFSDAAGDIYQHRVRNFDWDTTWVFTDRRFNLLHGPDAEFLRFLCETVNPVVQPDNQSSKELVGAYNDALRTDGWEIVEGKRISDRVTYEARKVGARAEVFGEPTGWQKVDRQVQEIRSRLKDAATEEQFQTVGLLCREALISVAQVVFDPAAHPTIDGTQASETDAKRMLEAIFAIKLKGGSSDEARAHAKAAVNLALTLQHKRTANFTLAALCAEATLSVINLLAILEERRGRSLGKSFDLNA